MIETRTLRAVRLAEPFITAEKAREGARFYRTLAARPT